MSPQLVGLKNQQLQQHETCKNKHSIIMNMVQPNELRHLHLLPLPRYSTSKMVHLKQRTNLHMMMMALLLAATILIFPLINCQITNYDTDCKHNRNNHHHHHQRSHPARQQRQFNSNNNQRLNQNAALSQQQQQPPVHKHRSTEMEHEEFSLALSGGGGGPTNGQQQVAHSNYTLLPTVATQTPDGSVSPATGSSGAAGQQQQAAQSKDAQQQAVASATDLVKNTTPALPNDSIGSPVMLQPPATTSSSIVAAPITRAGQSTTIEPMQNSTNQLTAAQSNSEDPQLSFSIRQLQIQQQQQTTNNNSQIQTTARSGGGGNIFASSEGFQTRQEDGFTSGSVQQVPAFHQLAMLANNNQPQPVSSSPSSISIITPLIGPPQTQSQYQPQTHTASVSASIGGQPADSSSAMMKPIFVVGNPLSERDYNSPYQYDTQQQQHSQQQTSGDSGQASVKAPKSVETSPVASTQSQDQQSSQHLQSQQQTKMLAPATRMPAYNNQQHPSGGPTSRMDKSAESSEMAGSSSEQAQPPPNTTGVNHLNQMGADRMGGPPLVYTDGHLATVSPPLQEQPLQVQQQQQSTGNGTSASSSLQPPTPRLYQGPQGSSSNAGGSGSGAAVVGNNPRRPSLPPPVNQANAASGFRSPLSPSGPLIGAGSTTAATSSPMSTGSSLQPPLNSLSQSQQQSLGLPNFYQTSPPYAGANVNQMGLGFGQGSLAAASMQAMPTMNYNSKQAFVLSQTQGLTGNQQQQQPQNGNGNGQQNVAPPQMLAQIPGSGYTGRRPLNITRVEHISAECSNDLIRAVIVFNGTFKGIIYSSGYVSDPTCLYVNGTGSTRYEFSIRLNQCGTLGRQELHQPTIPGEARRRDQVMWNTLSIQYNSIIEQEWDEHFRVSCEYGSDFWKTVSFSPFNVETNTGSPVVFTINPPQCQMDVLLGHGMGPKIAVDGPVTVGDPLTLLIHMKSEKAGYDILVKNCVAHNGGKQRMQLIDSNGCVVNERFISPFRGTYNDNDLRHVTLYAYLKAFRFTGSPVLYLECEIHMCQSACPPQMCYWRRLSKRSVDDFEYEYTTNSSSGNGLAKLGQDEQPVISDSLNLFKALQVRQEPEPTRARHQMREIYAEDDEAALICYRHMEVCIFLTTIASLLALIITIAITCCCRIRKLTRNQFEHNRLATSAGSLSPSLLSISDAISSTSGSFVSLNGAKSSLHQSWNHLQQANNNQSATNHLQKQQQQHRSNQKASMYLQRQPAEGAARPPPQPISSFQARAYAAACSP